LSDGLEYRSVGHILSLHAISKSFGAVVIADQLDLDLEEGEALGMLGPNGAGKTTLFGIITGTIAADSGRMMFDGRDITRLSPVRRSRLGMARSFQIPQPFGGMTVFENLVVAAACVRNTRESDVHQLAAETLADCDLLDKANQKAATLTLLDRKRLELARALATRPRILLLDEVAGGLSEPECESLVALIKRVRQSGISLVWIEHIMHALIAVVDRIVVLAGGIIIADDKPNAVLQNPRVAEIYMGITADV
jgi:branched-chain amino acid transport system ATP-binding protein